MRLCSTRTRRSTPRAANLRTWLQWLTGILAAGAIGCTPAETPARPTVSLRIRGTPASATVVIDEESLGSLDFVAAHGVALPPGLHHVTVRAVGYFPSDETVEARPGAHAIDLTVALIPIPD